MAVVELKEEECSLLRRTKTLLEKTDKTDLQIYADTGLQPSWLDTVRSGATRNPSVNRIQRLYEYLTEKKLAV